MKKACVMRGISKKFSSIIGNEQGYVVVLVALAMVVIFGFTALAIDGGSLYLEKNQLQKAADAAVLAGAQELLKEIENVKDVAKAHTVQIGSENEVVVSSAFSSVEHEEEKVFTLENDGAIQFYEIRVGENYVEAEIVREHPLTFARVLGFDESPVRVLSRAEIGIFGSGKGISPIAIDDSTMQNKSELADEDGVIELKLTEDSGDGEQGNYGFLDLGGKGGGAQELAGYIKDGYDEPISEGDEYPTNTGHSFGPVRNAINGLIDSDLEDPNKAHCNDFVQIMESEVLDSNCDRIIITPIVNTLDVAGASEKVEVIGFAAFWLSEKISASDKAIKGKFIKTFLPGELGEGGAFGVHIIKLTK